MAGAGCRDSGAARLRIPIGRITPFAQFAQTFRDGGQPQFISRQTHLHVAKFLIAGAKNLTAPAGILSQVLELLVSGATNREIGERLFMAEKTASVHVSRILSKLDVRSRTEAAAVAHRHGIGVELDTAEL